MTATAEPPSPVAPALGPSHGPGRAAAGRSPASLIERVRGSALFAKLWRCGTVSVITTVLSNAVLVVLAGPVGLGAGWAAVVANAVGTGPSYALNRRWVWRHEGSDLWRQVVPFWVLSFSGLALSAMTVSVTASWADGAGLTGAARSVTLVTANVCAFAALWVAQFLLLDRVLFRHRRRPDAGRHPATDARSSIVGSTTS